MINYLELPNFGVLETKLDQEYVDLLLSYVDISNPKTNETMWTIYDDTQKFENNVLVPAINSYIEKWGYPCHLSTTHFHELKFNRFWARVSEYNHYQSIHNHHGVFSFVVWLKIPSDWKDEQEDIKQFYYPHATDFILSYTDTIGNIKTKNYKLCPDMEGTMIVFPSQMNHSVMPGSLNNGVRISVAGDISISSKDFDEELR